MNKNKEWEEEFDKEFQDLNNLYPETGETLKSFISKAILSAEEAKTREILDEIMDEFGSYDNGCGCCADSTLQHELSIKYKDILSLPDQKELSINKDHD